MKTKVEIIVNHPWWHKILLRETQHAKSEDSNAEDPDTKMPAVSETRIYSCTWPNCKFHKTITDYWCDY